MSIAIKDAVFVIVDTETTGLDPSTSKIVEFAAVATDAKSLLGMWATLVDGRPCNAETSAIHTLTDADLDGAPLWEDAELDWLRFSVAMQSNKTVAHNAPFDQGFVEQQGPENEALWLCTRRLAKHLVPDALIFKNQVLRYHLNLHVDTFGIDAHRALGDALVTAALLRHLLPLAEARGIETVDELCALAETPILYPVLVFGSKHRGMPMGDVPISYLDWMVANVRDLDRDMDYTLKHELSRRRGGMIEMGLR